MMIVEFHILKRELWYSYDTFLFRGKNIQIRFMYYLFQYCKTCGYLNWLFIPCIEEGFILRLFTIGYLISTVYYISFLVAPWGLKVSIRLLKYHTNFLKILSFRNLFLFFMIFQHAFIKQNGLGVLFTGFEMSWKSQ